MEKVEIECTLDKVETVRKRDGVIGKAAIVWQIRDFTKITKLSQMQNAIVKVSIEDPQQDLYDEAMDRQGEMDLEGDGEQPVESQDSEPLAPPWHDEQEENETIVGEIEE